MWYLMLLDLGISFLQQYLGNMKAAKVPIEVAQAIEASIAALMAHKQDIITKSNLDSLRG